MKNLGILIFVFAFSLTGFAQPLNKSTSDSMRRLGEELYEMGDYYNALEQFQESYKED